MRVGVGWGGGGCKVLDDEDEEDDEGGGFIDTMMRKGQRLQVRRARARPAALRARAGTG